MKILTIAVLALGMSAPAFAQESLEAKRDEKLKKPFLKKADWITDYDKAREEAKKSGKMIFAFFTRSYAPCPPCLALEGGALLTDDFVKFSKDYVLFCHITTQIPGEKYGELIIEKGGQGFPYLVFLDEEGGVVAVHEDDRSAEAFAKTGDKVKSYVALKQKAGTDPVAKIDFLILQLSLGRIKAEEAGQKFKDAGTPSKEQQARFDAELFNASFMEEVRAIGSEEEAKAVSKKYYDAFKAGKSGPTSDQAIIPYCTLIMTTADAVKDIETFAAMLKTLKDKFGSLPQAQAFFEAKEKRLEQLNADKK